MPDTSPFERLTFDAFYPAGTQPTDPVATLTAINNAIAYSAANNVAVYGLSRLYQIRPPAGADNNHDHIVLMTGAHIICDPGCVIQRAPDGNGDVFASGLFDFVGNPVQVVPGFDQVDVITDVLWSGGKFLGTKKTVEHGGVEYDQYAFGRVIHIYGNNIRFDNVSIETFNGIAMYLHGSGIALHEPRITDPYNGIPGVEEPSSAGIRFASGEGFRCWGGYVESSGDAAIQFSVDNDFGVPNIGDGNISNGGYIGTRGSSTVARFILVGTSRTGSISDVFFEACSGVGGAGSNAIKIQNRERPAGQNASAISNVMFRDVTVSIAAQEGASPREAVAITNDLAMNRAINNICFDNLVINNRAGAAFSVSTLTPNASPPPSKVQGIVWRKGGVFPADDGLASIILDMASDVIIDCIDIDCGPNQSTGTSVLSVGKTYDCRNILLRDVRIRNLATGCTGVLFDKANNSGCMGGRISGAAGAQAVSIQSNAIGCYVEMVDLSEVGTDKQIFVPSTISTTLRLEDNWFNNNQRRGFINTGAKANVAPETPANQVLTVTNSYVAVTTPGNTPVNITSILGGSEGDLLTVTVQGTQQATIKDNATLRLKGDCILNNAQDTLTLLRRPSDWVEISRSDNA